jgi:hypothetical protein
MELQLENIGCADADISMPRPVLLKKLHFAMSGAEVPVTAMPDQLLPAEIQFVIFGRVESKIAMP